MKITSIKAALRWAAINGAYAYCLWLALNGSIGATRLFIFALCFNTIITLVASCVEDIRKKAQEKGRSVPEWLSVGSDILIMAILVWNGWIWCAVATLVLCVAESNAFDPKYNKTK